MCVCHVCSFCWLQCVGLPSVYECVVVRLASYSCPCLFVCASCGCVLVWGVHACSSVWPDTWTHLLTPALVFRTTSGTNVSSFDVQVKMTRNEWNLSSNVAIAWWMNQETQKFLSLKQWLPNWAFIVWDKQKDSHELDSYELDFFLIFLALSLDEVSSLLSCGLFN